MKLKNQNWDVCIWSQDYVALTNWYKEKLGFEFPDHLTLPDDTGFGLRLGGNYLYIGKHSEIQGKNKDPFRIMISFNVESVKETYEELKDKGVEFLAEPFPAPPGDFWCATFKDLDGNILQFMGDE